MMLSRRAPRPTAPSTKKPSSSGPRCTMLSHMRLSSPGSTARAGSWKTMPAIPHMGLPRRHAEHELRLVEVALEAMATLEDAPPLAAEALGRARVLQHPEDTGGERLRLGRHQTRHRRVEHLRVGGQRGGDDGLAPLQVRLE